ncbi:MAG TPA: nitroreductase family protein [Candidatus Cloacimonadota bacterium]|nr:nitroreductase family protein [Candidatus Cloacimonadota bacterium]HPY96994.1 nitroreductase family protein [Candidatus Cloacimonadota bacterium]HQB41704.1 nitroreductase family protein [Candidatus Cloacimonadota bacterium]
MEVLDYIYNRYSVRDFKSDAIPDDVLDTILEAGRLAPSGQNRQCWQFIVVTDKDIIKKIARHSFIGLINHFLSNAPVVIVACADPEKSLVLNDQPMYLVDLTLSFQQMIMAAWNYGIGSCWLGGFHEKSLKKVLNIPEQIRIVAMSPFGYPAEKKSFYSKVVSLVSSSKKRLAKEQIIHYNIWEDK